MDSQDQLARLLQEVKASAEEKYNFSRAFDSETPISFKIIQTIFDLLKTQANSQQFESFIYGMLQVYFNNSNNEEKKLSR